MSPCPWHLLLLPSWSVVASAMVLSLALGYTLCWVWGSPWAVLLLVLPSLCFQQGRGP